jgi:hypothetical protein
MQHFPPSAGFNLNLNAIRSGSQSQKARIERNFRAGPSRLTRKRRNQSRALDDKVGLGQRDLRGAAIGEEFKPANLV